MAVSKAFESFDIEKDASSDRVYFSNESVKSFSWESISVTVKDRHTKQPLEILSGVNGHVEAGALLRAYHIFHALTQFSR